MPAFYGGNVNEKVEKILQKLNKNYVYNILRQKNLCKQPKHLSDNQKIVNNPKLIDFSTEQRWR